MSNGNLEEWLDGKFEKWNNNATMVKDDEHVPQAFTHYSWHITSQQLMLCDLLKLMSPQ
jgi:hypothetical protein